MAELVKNAIFLQSPFSFGDNQHEICAFPMKSAIKNPNLFGFSLSATNDFFGRCITPRGPLSLSKFNRRNSKSAAGSAQMSIGIKKAPKWWEKGLQPNMKEVTGAQDLVDSLLGAGDKLVVVDFFSPGCGGCKALHPKIKKFKDALTKYGADCCSLGPVKGLEEKVLLALAANKDLGFACTPKTKEPAPVGAFKEEMVIKTSRTSSSHPNALPPLPLPLPLNINFT